MPITVNKTKCVTVLVRKSKFKSQCLYSDTNEGRVILVSLDQSPFKILGIYAPTDNSNKYKFWKKLYKIYKPYIINGHCFRGF